MLTCKIDNNNHKCGTSKVVARKPTTNRALAWVRGQSPTKFGGFSAQRPLPLMDL